MSRNTPKNKTIGQPKAHRTGEAEQIQHLQNQIMMLQTALRSQGKTFNIISHPSVDQPIEAVSLGEAQYQADRAYQEGYRLGYDTGAKVALSEMQNVLNDLGIEHKYLNFLLASLAELRALVFSRQAGLRYSFYRDRLSYYAGEIGRHAINWKNAAAEHHQKRIDHRNGIIQPISDGPMLQIVSDAQDGITAALTGDDEPLVKMFGNHQWYEDMLNDLGKVELGGNPGGNKDYRYNWSTWLTREAQALKGEHPKWNAGDIRRRIMYELKKKLKDKEPMLDAEREALQELQVSKDPDRMIRNRLK